MILYGALIAATILACEVALRLPFGQISGTLSQSSSRAMYVVGSRQISDTWKERTLPVYAWRILKASIGLLLCLLAIAGPVLAVVGLAMGSLAGASAFLVQPVPLLVMTGVGIGYIWARLRLVRSRDGAAPAALNTSSDYSALDKTLHRVILGNPMISELLPGLDARFARNAPPARAPVYVTGLARAGTTALMRALYGSGQFSSLTYADMPFVQAPNLWAWMSRTSRKKRAAKERAHGDGVIVDFDAPEALEEVFWRNECGTSYIQNTGLVPHTPEDAAFAAYRAYLARICHRYGRPRYLAKNNNMMLRLRSLAGAMPEARILVAVRDPVAQAQSLLNQHLRFATADEFTRTYMTWLVHHEFGADQRPFRLPGHPVPQGPPDRLTYWLTAWVACYGWLRDIIAEGHPNISPVLYERLGRDPEVWAKLCDFVELPRDTPADLRPVPPPPDPEDVDPGLLAEARAIYADLAARAF